MNRSRRPAPSPQAIQSVAVHLLTLHGVFAHGLEPGQALWLRRRALREGHGPRAAHFTWLTPPSFANTLTIAAIVAEATPAARSALAATYVRQIWSVWLGEYEKTINAWYDQFVKPD
jgi:hypothetical protein